MNTRLLVITAALLSTAAYADDADAGTSESTPVTPVQTDPQNTPAAETAPAPKPEPVAAPMPAAAPAPAAQIIPPGMMAVISKFNATLYGFAEFDGMYDSTEGLNDLVGNSLIARPDTYNGQHGRMTFSARNTRIGFKLSGPEWHGIKGTGVIEADFLGSQPTTISDAATFANPTFRIRHAYVKMETPVLDVLIGQYWQLFGWQSAFFPAAVELQGNLGQVYSRAPQIRLSKTVKTDAVNLDFALAASRPGQRDSGLPDGQAGIKLTVNNWKTVRTASSTGTSVDGLGIGLSGVARSFNVTEFSDKPKKANSLTGWGYAADVFIPIVTATNEDRSNALSLSGEFARGAGIADYYTSLSGGVSNASLPIPSGMTTAPTLTPNVDGGLVVYDKFGNLTAIDWSTFIVGAQYYFPGGGNVWAAVDFAHIHSNNSKGHGSAKAVLDRANWASVNLFWDATKAVRLGLSYSYTAQWYVDQIKAENHRVQLSAFYIF